VGNVRQVNVASIAGAHVVVVQGRDGGGVLDSKGVPVEGPGELLPLDEIVDEAVVALESLASLGYPHRPQQYRPLLIGAGGVSNGADVARLLRKGADGVALGTRFAVCTESDMPEEEKIGCVLATAPEQLQRENPDHSRTHMGAAAQGWTLGTGANLCDVNRPAREIIQEIVDEAMAETLKQYG
jgi:glutamate synthase domain-containing protein 2